jgi:hypothetical protein
MIVCASLVQLDERRAIMTSNLAPVELDKQLAQLKDKLDAEYGTQVHAGQVIDEERGRFADASIRSFLPILIERSVRTRLATART